MTDCEEVRKYINELFLPCAVMKADQSWILEILKDNININTLNNGNTILDQLLIFLIKFFDYSLVNDYINTIKLLIKRGANLSSELDYAKQNLNLTQENVFKEVSNFIQLIDNDERISALIAYTKQGIIFTKINNAKLKVSKLLESDFCKYRSLFFSHFDINGNKGYVQKDQKTNKRNYVVYNGSIKMMVNWTSVTLDDNGCQIKKKESIYVYIKDDGTAELDKQDRSKYEELNFDTCNVLIGGVKLKDALDKACWLSYLNDQEEDTKKDSLVPDIVSQEDNFQLVDLDSNSSYYVDMESNAMDSSDGAIDYPVFEEPMQGMQGIEDNTIKEENELCLKMLDSKKLDIKLDKKKCNYEQQMSITYIEKSILNGQENLQHSNQNNNIEGNMSNFDNQYHDSMNTDVIALAVIDNTVNCKCKVDEWLNNINNMECSTQDLICSNIPHSRKDSFNTISSFQESDKSSEEISNMNWDYDDLILPKFGNRLDLDYNSYGILSKHHNYKEINVSSVQGLITHYNLNDVRLSALNNNYEKGILI